MVTREPMVRKSIGKRLVVQEEDTLPSMHPI